MARQISEFFYQLKTMIDNGHSPLIVICGLTGTGKTVTGLSLSMKIAKHIFNRDWFPTTKKNVFVDVLDFLYAIKKSEHEILLIDEAVSQLNSRQWWSDFNNAFFQSIATQRYKGNIYIVILPITKDLALSHRRMIDYLIEMDADDSHEAKVWWIKKYPSELFKSEMKKISLGEKLSIQLPPKDVMDAYSLIEKPLKEGIIDEHIKRLEIKRRLAIEDRVLSPLEKAINGDNTVFDI